jgi:hypothetical protein
MTRKWIALAIAGLCAGSGAAWAESAQIRGKFPANVREADLLENVVVDRFNGSDARQFEAALEQAIGVPAGRPDGVLSGGVTTGVEESKYQGNEERCVEWKDGKQDGTCTKKAKVDLPCFRRVINLTVSVRLLRTADNMPVWSDNKPSRDETTWCQGKAPWRTTEEAVSAMITDLAQKIRLDVRPRWETYKVRFREDRNGMPKDLGNEFKDIVKLSNRDVTSACRQWTDFNGRLPNHPSVLYNLGVCAEAAGSYADAQSFYRSAQAALPKRASDMADSADRVARLMIARADDEERARRPGNSR